MNLDFLKQDAEQADPVSNTALERLQSLVALYEQQAAEVQAAEEHLAQAKKAFNTTSMEDIPNVLLGAGLSELKLADGRKVKVKEEISASIKDQKAFATFAAERGDDDILKTTLQLGKVPENILSTIKRLLAENLDIYPEVSTTIHNATLKKYVKEICGVGMEDPESRLGERYVPMHELPEFISVYRYYKTAIK